MRRLLVFGGHGFFGAALAARLREGGATPLLASRGGRADVRIDVENAESLRAALRPGDVLVDCVGPFQDRSTRLVEAAIEAQCDVVDIADSLAYAERVDGLRDRIERSGIRVLNACSSVSAVSAAMVRLSGAADPVRVSVFLAPATRYSGSPATAASLLRSVGREVRVLRQGRLAAAAGWGEGRSLHLPPPVGRLRGRLFESADSFWLPKIWPGLQTVDLVIDSRVPGLNGALALAARRPWLRRCVERFQGAGLALARRLGSRTGCLAVEVEERNGSLRRSALVPSDHGYLIAVIPAAMAALDLAADRFHTRGLVPPDLHVDPQELLARLREAGVQYATS